MKKFIGALVILGMLIFPVAAIAQDTATKTLVLTVASTLTITTSSLPTADPSVAYSVQLEATGGVTPYIWSESGALPAGLTFTSGGILSGTPAAASSGSYSLTFTCTDSAVPANVRSIRVVTNQ
jgi:Putative Ig domain